MQDVPGVYFRTLTSHEDARGSLIELERSDDRPFSHTAMMSYISWTNPGSIRGPHEHRHQTDLFSFFSGDGVFYLWENRGEKYPLYGLKQPTRICIDDFSSLTIVVPPGIVHGYRCVSERLGCVNMPDELYRGRGRNQPVDEIRHEDDPDSLFKISN